MTPSVSAALTGDLSAFSGARLSGTIPVREDALRESLRDAVSQRRGRVQDVDIRIGTNNLLELGIRVGLGPFSKWFRPRFVLSPELLYQSGPAVVLTAASSDYASLMSIAQTFASEVFPKGLSIDGRQLRLNLALMPQLAPARPFFRYLRGLHARTDSGVLFLDFNVQVNE